MEYAADFHSAPVATKRVEFPGGAWVEIRTQALAGDKLAQSMDARQGDAGADLSFNAGRFRLELLYRRIVAWSSSQPITRRAVEAMPEEMADRLLEEIDAATEGRSDDEKKGSDASSPSSS